jgi:hypothetical protein
MGLFDRNPRELTEITADEERKETRRQEREADYITSAEDKYASKGLKRAARAIGLENLRPVDAELYHSRVEGDLLLHGELITLALAADVRIRNTTGILGSNFEYRDVNVHVLHGEHHLGSVNYEWSSNLLSGLEERYSHAGTMPYQKSSKAAFLRRLESEIELVRGADRDVAAPTAPPAGAPELSALESSPDELAPQGPADHSVHRGL